MERCIGAKLAKVDLWGGIAILVVIVMSLDMYANGVQCIYHTNDEKISSPLFLGACDKPSCSSLYIARAVLVGARCGDIVDSVNITCGEECSRVGGDGGSYSEIRVPDGWCLKGIYGGTDTF